MSKIASWDDQWVGYDDDETQAYKRNYASTNCMKGVMFWSIDQGLDWSDGTYSLQRSGSVAISYIELDFKGKGW